MGNIRIPDTAENELCHHIRNATPKIELWLRHLDKKNATQEIKRTLAWMKLVVVAYEQRKKKEAKDESRENQGKN